MTGIACHGGLTQIGRILDHAEKAAAKAPVAALVYVGDAMEEDIDRLCAKAGALGLRNVRAFMFLEGSDPDAERAFREIARLTGGVMLPFDARAAGELRALLGAVAAFAAGGRAALEAQRVGRGEAPARRPPAMTAAGWALVALLLLGGGGARDRPPAAAPRGRR